MKILYMIIINSANMQDLSTLATHNALQQLTFLNDVTWEQEFVIDPITTK